MHQEVLTGVLVNLSYLNPDKEHTIQTEQVGNRQKSADRHSGRWGVLPSASSISLPECFDTSSGMWRSPVPRWEERKGLHDSRARYRQEVAGVNCRAPISSSLLSCRCAPDSCFASPCLAPLAFMPFKLLPVPFAPFLDLYRFPSLHSCLISRVKLS